ncbi:MAG: hypothetical protein ACJASQ_002663 [Crocinitomicaceae bacterium]|jgi:hypothetical protein
MRGLIITGGLLLAGGAIILMSIQTKYVMPELDHADPSVQLLSAPDSVTHYEVEKIIEKNLVVRLEGKAGIEASWGFMDKSGHRNMIFTNVDLTVKNSNNNWVKLSENNEVFGDVVRMDGSFRSHVCSFKIVYPEKKIFVRRSALDDWQGIVEFTGVDTPIPMREKPIRDEE